MGCGRIRTSSTSASRASQPLVLERDLCGIFKAWGTVEDRWGRLRRTFTADIEGR